MEINASMIKDLRDQTGAGMMDCKKALVECDGNMDDAINWLREKGIAKSAKKESRIAAEGLAGIYVNDKKAVVVELNCETDFVSKNPEFKSLLDTIGNTILNSNATTLEEAKTLKADDISINDLITEKVSKIGEKISLRRFEVVEKEDGEVFGTYIHQGGSIAALTVLSGANESVAKDVAMQAAAMKPLYVTIEEVPADIIDNEKSVLKEQAINEGKDATIAEKMVEGRIKKFFKEICLEEQAFIKDGDMNVSKYVSMNNGKIVKMIRYEVGEGMEKRSDNFAEEVMNQVKGN